MVRRAVISACSMRGAAISATAQWLDALSSLRVVSAWVARTNFFLMSRGIMKLRLHGFDPTPLLYLAAAADRGRTDDLPLTHLFELSWLMSRRCFGPCG